MHRILSRILAIVGSLVLAATPIAASEVDLEIVLAVDVSGSVDSSEYDLQVQGLVSAFRDPEIQQAIVSGPRGRVAVALMYWAAARQAKQQSKWFVLDSPQSVRNFANVIERFDKDYGGYRGIGGGDTGIGAAVAHATKMIVTNGIRAARRVIDVSGDGVESGLWNGPAILLPEARLLAQDADITINGLAILNDYPNLDVWYQRNVILGPASFVIRAKDFRDFKRAIRKKLWREFSSPIALETSPADAMPKQLARIARDP